MKRDINRNDLKGKRKKYIYFLGFNIYTIVTQFIIHMSEMKREREGEGVEWREKQKR